MSEHFKDCDCIDCAGGESALTRLHVDSGTFNATDIQAWIDSLAPRETAMLAHVIESREFSAAVRSVVGVILRVQRQATRAGAELAGRPVQ